MYFVIVGFIACICYLYFYYLYIYYLCIVTVLPMQIALYCILLFEYRVCYICYVIHASVMF